MDVRWSKGCDIPTSESSHVQPLTSNNFSSNQIQGNKQNWIICKTLLQGMTLMHWACDRGNVELVKALIKLNANVNAQVSWFISEIQNISLNLMRDSESNSFIVHLFDVTMNIMQYISTIHLVAYIQPRWKWARSHRTPPFCWYACRSKPIRRSLCRRFKDMRSSIAYLKTWFCTLNIPESNFHLWFRLYIPHSL